MFSRYTERAQQTIILAQEAARRLRFDYVGTEHLLLGIVMQSGGVALHALEQLGIGPSDLREEVERMIGQGGASRRGEIGFTPRAKQVMVEYAPQEARHLGDRFVGSEHILTGLFHDEFSVAARVLRGRGLDLESFRRTVRELRQASPAPAPDAITGAPPVEEEDPLGGRVAPLGPKLQSLMLRASAEARNLGARMLELEHFLLAALQDPDDSTAGALIREQGITREWLLSRLRSPN